MPEGTHRRELVLQEVLLQAAAEQLLIDDEIKGAWRVCEGKSHAGLAREGLHAVHAHHSPGMPHAVSHILAPPCRT